MFKKIIPILIFGAIVAILEAMADEPIKAMAAAVVSMLASFAVGLFTKNSKSADDLVSQSGMNAERKGRAQTVDDLVVRYGEPDDVLLLVPTLGNDAHGVVLVYKERRQFIINGEVISFDDIEDVTFNNASIAYTPDSYQVVITLKDKPQSYLYLPVGNDNTWALQVVEDIRQHMKEEKEKV
ncbi:MAG: hypothetical protein J5734_02620 [Prevotella sp.]|nr:hypothetical protein [Prevotella sp.]